jgi:hypothetical protein
VGIFKEIKMKNLKPINDFAKEMLVEHGPTHAFSYVEKKFDAYVKAQNNAMADYYCLVLENLYARAAEWAKK